MRISHSVEIAATAARASEVILAPENLPSWFSGAKVVDVDPAWPQVGSTFVWSSGGKFTAKVTENGLPWRLVSDVATPTGLSRVTHRFEDLTAGRCRYEKIVEREPSGIGKLLAPLTGAALRRFVRGEVERAGALVERLG